MFLAKLFENGPSFEWLQGSRKLILKGNQMDFLKLSTMLNTKVTADVSLPNNENHRKHKEIIGHLFNVINSSSEASLCIISQCRFKKEFNPKYIPEQSCRAFLLLPPLTRSLEYPR